MHIVALLVVYFKKIIHRLWVFLYRPLFKKCGRNVHFGMGCDFSYSNITIGNDVYIGPGATFNTAISQIRIGNKVLFGPNVTIMGGDHRTDIIGKYMFDVDEKLPSNDKDVVIEDDVWIGANVTILKGVTVGRGSIIGAGSIVVKDVPPYTVYVGIPPLKTRSRWTSEEIKAHECLLTETQQY